MLLAQVLADPTLKRSLLGKSQQGRRISQSLLIFFSPDGLLLFAKGKIIYWVKIQSVCF
jgi:hypothetical protein